MYLCKLIDYHRKIRMKRFLFVLSLICLLGLTACHSGKKENVLLSRTFPTYCWERFDFITRDITLEKPTTYDLALKVAFDPSYEYNHLMVVFTIFDTDDQPLRSKGYKFQLKEPDGSWKSELVDGSYHFILPINNELSLNEPGTYKFQLESRMPVTPLLGIKEISIINQ